MLDSGLNATRTFTGAPVDRPASARRAARRANRSSAEPPHGLLWSLPCIVGRRIRGRIRHHVRLGWPSWRGRVGSSPSNHGSPSPMGSPTMARSTLEPMEFRCFLVVSISSAMLLQPRSRHRSASQVSLAQRGGQRSVDCASTSPTAPRWASMPMPRFSSHGRRTRQLPPRRSSVRLTFHHHAGLLHRWYASS